MSDATKNPERVAVAEARIRAALEHIEEAQRQLGYAQQALSPVIGMVREWERLGRLYDKVKAHWYRVREKLGKLRERGGPGLDHEPDEYDAKYLRGGSD